MRTEYQEVNLDKVTKFYADGFEMKPGESLFDYEAFVDVGQGTIIFRLVIKDQEVE